MNKYNNFTVEETNLLSIYMTGSKAVSYTHLDVYKRQGYHGFI